MNYIQNAYQATKKVIFIKYIFFTIIFISCDKEQEYKYNIEGYVKSNNVPISNAEIHLQRLFGELFTASYETIYSTTSDNNGFFNILYTSNVYGLRLFVISYDKFYVNNMPYAKYGVKKIRVDDVITDLGDIELNPFGLFTINFAENTTFSEGDTLVLTVDAYTHGSCSSIYSWPSSKNYLVTGNKYVYIKWQIKRKKEKQYLKYNDSLFCLPFVNNTYELKL